MSKYYVVVKRWEITGLNEIHLRKNIELSLFYDDTKKKTNEHTEVKSKVNHYMVSTKNRVLKLV